MTIYIDELRSFQRLAKPGSSYTSQQGRPASEWCHMATDEADLEVLHDFAKSLGLTRKWFQDHSAHPHYDLIEQMRRKARVRGAVEVDSVTLIKTCSLKYNKQLAEARRDLYGERKSSGKIRL